jgi:hypothetical protein
MDVTPPPVIDATRQVRIGMALEEAKNKLLSPFNIAAMLVFLLVVFFLYKRYRDKKATETAHGSIVPPK